MRTVYTIQDNVDGSWCKSSKLIFFTPNFSNAAIFFTKESAEKAITNMYEMMIPGVDTYPDLAIVEYSLNRVMD